MVFFSSFRVCKQKRKKCCKKHRFEIFSSNAYVRYYLGRISKIFYLRRRIRSLGREEIPRIVVRVRVKFISMLNARSYPCSLTRRLTLIISPLYESLRYERFGNVVRSRRRLARYVSSVFIRIVSRTRDTRQKYSSRYKL